MSDHFLQVERVSTNQNKVRVHFARGDYMDFLPTTALYVRVPGQKSRYIHACEVAKGYVVISYTDCYSQPQALSA